MHYESLQHIYPQIQISIAALLQQIYQASEGLSASNQNVLECAVTTSPTCITWASNFYKKF